MANPSSRRRRLPLSTAGISTSSPHPSRSTTSGLWKYSFVFVAGIVVGHLHARLVWSNGGAIAIDEASSLMNLVEPTSEGVQQGVSVDSKDGWHSIDVFYGDAKHLSADASLEWFSQCRQDELVVALLRGKRNGYFIDLAANDATVLSNTYVLEQRYGWTGLCIEPNPIYWANLTYRDCQVVGAVVGDTRMQEVHFRFDAGDKSGIVGDGFYNGKQFERVSTPRYTVSLKEILERYNVPRHIDYLSLDVEGAEEFIMKSFPLTDYNISILTVEKPLEPLRNHLETNGYKHMMRFSRWGETLYIHESSMQNKVDLSVLDRFDPKKQKQRGERLGG